MKDIIFAGHQFVLCPSGLLIWPGQKTAIVADLHLEKGSHYAAQGQMLPPHDSADTLQKLSNALEYSGCNTLILLGDSFHDPAGYQRLDEQSFSTLQKITKTYKITWIVGNHDGLNAVPHTEAVANIQIDNIIFRHEAENGSEFEISGHYHPKASVKIRGKRVTRPCFIQSEQRLVLPSYGSFTGGLDCKDIALQSFFANEYTAHLLGQKQIYSVPDSKLF